MVHQHTQTSLFVWKHGNRRSKVEIESLKVVNIHMYGVQ